MLANYGHDLDADLAQLDAELEQERQERLANAGPDACSFCGETDHVEHDLCLSCRWAGGDPQQFDLLPTAAEYARQVTS